MVISYSLKGVKKNSYHTLFPGWWVPCLSSSWRKGNKKILLTARWGQKSLKEVYGDGQPDRRTRELWLKWIYSCGNSIFLTSEDRNAIQTCISEHSSDCSMFSFLSCVVLGRGHLSQIHWWCPAFFLFKPVASKVILLRIMLLVDISQYTFEISSC